MRHLILVVVLLLMAFLSACAQPGTDHSEPSGVIDELGPVPVEWQRIRQGGVVVCGSAPQEPLLEGAMLLLTSQQSYSCRDVGYGLRRLRRIPELGGNLLVAARASEGGELCDFLREERLSIPVLALNDREFNQIVREPALTLLLRSGEAVQIIRAATGAQVVERVSSGRAGANSSSYRTEEF